MRSPCPRWNVAGWALAVAMPETECGWVGLALAMREAGNHEPLALAMRAADNHDPLRSKKGNIL